WLLTEAQKLCPASHAELAAELSHEIAALDAIAVASHASLLAADLRPYRRIAEKRLRGVGRALGGRRGSRPLQVIESRQRHRVCAKYKPLPTRHGHVTRSLEPLH